ncbi:MAG: ribonuclease HI family protein [Actinomycetota bacterium]
MKAVLHTDGGARGNPGPAGIGVVLERPDGAVVADLARGIGNATNNVAEYRALIAGLELALERGVTELDIRVDSELVVNQINGDWKLKDDRLRVLAVKARSLMRRFESASISHVRREQNAGADRLANQGMDEAMAAADADDLGQTSFLE